MTELMGYSGNGNAIGSAYGGVAGQVAGLSSANKTMGGRRHRKSYGKHKRPVGNRRTFRKKKRRGSRRQLFKW
jgi:hypothetical protein